MLPLLLVAQLAVYSFDLSKIPAPVVSMDPVEVDNSPKTQHWLIFTNEGLYYLAQTAPTVCLSPPFHPWGTGPTLLPRPAYPVRRVGSLDAFVVLQPPRVFEPQYLFVYRLPTGCTDPTVWPR